MLREPIILTRTEEVRELEPTAGEGDRSGWLQLAGLTRLAKGRPKHAIGVNRRIEQRRAREKRAKEEEEQGPRVATLTGGAGLSQRGGVRHARAPDRAMWDAAGRREPGPDSRLRPTQLRNAF